MRKIKEIRELRGYSRDYVAKQIDITTMGLGYLENNKRNITDKRLGQLSKLLDCTTDQLLGKEPLDSLYAEKMTKKPKIISETNEPKEKTYPIIDEYSDLTAELIEELVEEGFLEQKDKMDTELIFDFYKVIYDYAQRQQEKEKTQYIKKKKRKFKANNLFLKSLESENINLDNKITKILNK